MTVRRSRRNEMIPTTPFPILHRCLRFSLRRGAPPPTSHPFRPFRVRVPHCSRHSFLNHTVNMVAPLSTLPSSIPSNTLTIGQPSPNLKRQIPTNDKGRVPLPRISPQCLPHSRRIPLLPTSIPQHNMWKDINTQWHPPHSNQKMTTTATNVNACQS